MVMPEVPLPGGWPPARRTRGRLGVGHTAAPRPGSAPRESVNSYSCILNTCGTDTPDTLRETGTRILTSLCEGGKGATEGSATGSLAVAGVGAASFAEGLAAAAGEEDSLITCRLFSRVLINCAREGAAAALAERRDEYLPSPRGALSHRWPRHQRAGTGPAPASHSGAGAACLPREACKATDVSKFSWALLFCCYPIIPWGQCVIC